MITHVAIRFNGVIHALPAPNRSKSQPPGQRVIDKVAWAREILNLYGDIDIQVKSCA